MITEDDFNSWRENPVTVSVFKALGNVKERAKAAWMTASWEGGDVDKLLLTDLVARCQAIDDMTTLTFQQMERELAV